LHAGSLKIFLDYCAGCVHRFRALPASVSNSNDLYP